MATFLSYISSDIRSGEKKRPEIQDFPVLLLFTDAGSTFLGEISSLSWGEGDKGKIELSAK